jgi:hypothetical protein
MLDKRLTIAGLIGAAMLASAPAWAQGSALPWGESSDQLAWEVLVQVVSPAGVPGKKDVVFETWASDQDIYATNPPVWPPVSAPKKLQPSLLDKAKTAHSMRLEMIAGDTPCKEPKHPAVGNFPPPPACIAEEVRRNWDSFQNIVANNLHTTAGLVAAFNNPAAVNLPSSAIEVKGDWVKIGDMLKWIPALKTPQDVRAAYYTNTGTVNGVTEEYALVGLAMSSKQIKDWVWMTFEHRMSPGRCDTIGCHDSFGAIKKDVSPLPKVNQDYGPCAKTPKLLAMIAAAGLDKIWMNYCLKGSQITFVKGNQPTLLGNSVVERINADLPLTKSSCISCHSYASFDKNGKPNFGALSEDPIGPTKPALMQGFKSTDFIWGILAIPRKN